MKREFYIGIVVGFLVGLFAGVVLFVVLGFVGFAFMTQMLQGAF